MYLRIKIISRVRCAPWADRADWRWSPGHRGAPPWLLGFRGGGEAFGGVPPEIWGAVGGALVVAQQGKSPRCQLWPYELLRASNAQLRELSPRRLGGDPKNLGDPKTGSGGTGGQGGGYVVPPGGLEEGLCGQAVLLYPKNEGD
ncbi:actin maturation protease-like [Anas platyrhynchos]|uniref:actin maturation protease-like n=1 Tax=Anas platyrhynchos TaxID=8839 RepID=UPI003AF2696E